MKKLSLILVFIVYLGLVHSMRPSKCMKKEGEVEEDGETPNSWETFLGSRKRNLAVCTHKNEKFFKVFNVNVKDNWDTSGSVARVANPSGHIFVAMNM